MVNTQEQGRVHMMIAGRVQGVFFRASAKDKAWELNLTGWVRNLRNGSVEIVAEGMKPSLQELITWCRKGPPGAYVTDCEIREEDYRGEFNAFEVTY
jgi:acylphosphatase